MRRIAFFPGSFDPMTKGHEDIVRRALPMFDKIIVAIGINSSKNGMFPLKQKQYWIEKTFSDCPSVEVINYKGLTINACKKHKAKFILSGLRNSNDYEYEKSIAMINQAMEPSIETIYFNTHPECVAISSSIVRDIINNSGNVKPFLASGVQL